MAIVSRASSDSVYKEMHETSLGGTVKPDLSKGHVHIERVQPLIDCGRYRVKAIAGDTVRVSANVFRDGTDILRAVVRYRGPGDRRWSEAPMSFVENDRWAGVFTPADIGIY